MEGGSSIFGQRSILKRRSIFLWEDRGSLVASISLSLRSTFSRKIGLAGIYAALQLGTICFHRFVR